MRWRIDARKFFDALMEGVAPRDDVTFESATVGDVPGLWVHPASRRSDDAILHVHGGWFNAGSATAYRHLVGHIAARAGTRAFVPDYRLAPEHPFPAAVGYSADIAGLEHEFGRALTKLPGWARRHARPNGH